MSLFLLLATALFAVNGEELDPEVLDLSGWVSRALENSPAIRASEASLMSAEASLRGDRSFLYPSLTASAGASRSWSSVSVPGDDPMETETDNFFTSLSLSQEILQSGGQNWLYEDASELSLQAAEADHRGEVLDVVLNVVNSYYDVMEAMELERSAAGAHQRSMSQLSRTESLYEMGAVTTLELLQVQVQESNDRLTLGRRRQALQSSYSDLYEASGVDPLSAILVDTAAVLNPISTESVERIQLDLANNPALEASEYRYRASGLRAEASGRSYWPSLRASAGWSWNDEDLEEIDGMFDNDGYNVGVTLSWNVFDGFLRESAISSSRASMLSAEASLEQLGNQLATTVFELRNTLALDVQYYHDSELALERASEQYRLSRMSYDMGALSLLDLLDAQTDLASAEANLVSAGVAALKTEALLMVTLGETPRLGE